MHHHPGRPAAQLAGLDRALQRLQAVLGDHVLRHPHLDAEQEIRIFRQRHGAGFHLGVVDIVEFGDREARQPVIGDVDEGVDPGPRLRHDVTAQRREVVDAGIAGRNRRGGALKLRQFVGGNPDRRAIGVDVAVQVDQARRHQFARCVDRLRRARGRNLRLDRLDHAPANADVAFSAQRLAGIEHVAALDHEVELVVRAHRGVGRCGEARRHNAAAVDPVSARKFRRDNAAMACSPCMFFYARMMRRARALRKPRRRWAFAPEGWPRPGNSVEMEPRDVSRVRVPPTASPAEAHLMPSNTLRFRLREGTSQAHASVDHLIGQFRSMADYERYARGIHAFRIPLEETTGLQDVDVQPA